MVWSDVCRLKEEGGVGIRPLREVNVVSYLKLIWRILSANSFWVNWVKAYLIRKGSFWMVNENTQSGSWMWRKLLKYRETTKKLYKVEVKNGGKTSFWYEVWSPMGCLKDVLCDGSYIGIGIQIHATVADSRNHRKRVHRNRLFNRVEDEIERYKVNLTQEKDISLWRNEKGKYKRRFTTRDTWLNIRENHLVCH